jgi:hypothetical protein
LARSLLSEFARNIDAMVAGEDAPDRCAGGSGGCRQNRRATSRFPSGPQPRVGSLTRIAPASTWLAIQYRGSLDAPVTVIEFSDLQCPFCKRHSLETQPILDEDSSWTLARCFGSSSISRSSIHPQAPAAGIAAECAAEQSKFWEMHELAAFENVERWSIEEPEPDLCRTGGRT